jgi:hypothetical protein
LLEEPFSGLAGHSGEDDRVVGGFGYGAHLIAELRLFSEAQKLPNSRAERPYALRRLLMVSGPTNAVGASIHIERALDVAVLDA